MRPIIVGAGPAGLTLAWLLRKRRPIIVERAGQIGGCHSVRRHDGEFSEHGPRVYSDTYVTTAKLLRDMGEDFESLFTPYKFSPASIGGKTLSSIHPSEIFQLAIAYTMSVVWPDHYKSQSMKEFCRDFSPETIDYFDRLCRLTDGAGLDNYSTYKFLQLANQNFGYQFYQPHRPNDEGLFKVWGEALARSGAEIILSAEVVRVLTDCNTNDCIHTDDSRGVTSRPVTTGIEYRTDTGELKTIASDVVVLAIPPRQLSAICPDGVFTPKSGRALTEWTRDNSYIDYITITYRWKEKLPLDSVWGFPATTWGIASVVLSDYFESTGTNEGESSARVASQRPHAGSPIGTLISVGITRVDTPVRGVTARNASDDFLIKEALAQLREVYPSLPPPDAATIGSRIGTESAYIQGSADPSPLPAESAIRGLYCAGTQNGESQYSFTSMETAVVNAVALAAKLGGEPFAASSQWTLNGQILVIFLLIMVLIIVFYSVRARSVRPSAMKISP